MRPAFVRARWLWLHLLAALLLLAAPAGGQLAWSGDVGFRSEYVANESFARTNEVRADDHRWRLRTRVRLGASWEATPKVSLGFRLSTGSGAYPSSAWSSLSDDFRRDAIALDRAFLRYAPGPDVALTFGIAGNALFRPTELVWDGDVSPAGLTQVWRRGHLEAVAGQYMLREVRSGRGVREASSFLLAQGLSYTWEEVGARSQLGLFSYVFTRPDVLATAIESGSLDRDFATNRSVPGDPGAFFSDFQIVGVSVTHRRGNWGLAAEASLNLGAASEPSLGVGYEKEEGFGWAALLTRGSLSGPGSWSVTAGYVHIEADAVLAAFNSDDLQQTNVRTVPVWVRLRLPGGVDLVWDTYVQSKINVALPSPGGLVHGENAKKVRTRLTLQAMF
jgi:hypothetical protein